MQKATVNIHIKDQSTSRNNKQKNVVSADSVNSKEGLSSMRDLLKDSQISTLNKHKLGALKSHYNNIFNKIWLQQGAL